MMAFDLLGVDNLTSGRKAGFHVPFDSSLFSGHFPQRPVLPGVGMLSMLDTLITSAVGEKGPVYVKALNRVKFLRLVESGGDFTVTLHPWEQPDWHSFEVSFQDSVVAYGNLACEKLAESGLALSSCLLNHPVNGGSIIDLDELIPQRPPMRIIDGITEIDQSGCRTFSTVTNDWPMVVKNSVPGMFLIEAIAQSSAVHTGWTLREQESMGGRGYLVGIREAELNIDRIPVGTGFYTRIKTIRKRNNFGVYDGIVSCNDIVLGSAVIQAFKP